jgi:transposase
MPCRKSNLLENKRARAIGAMSNAVSSNDLGDAFRHHHHDDSGCEPRAQRRWAGRRCAVHRSDRPRRRAPGAGVPAVPQACAAAHAEGAGLDECEQLAGEHHRLRRVYRAHPKATGRPRLHTLREILDAIFYVVRSACAWRLLPHDFPPWKTVYHSFRFWRLDGTWERVHAALRQRVRVRLKRNP